MSTTTVTLADLPGLDCGLCGVRTCQALVERLADEPALIQRCIPLSNDRFKSRLAPAPSPAGATPADQTPASTPSAAGTAGAAAPVAPVAPVDPVASVASVASVAPVVAASVWSTTAIPVTGQVAGAACGGCPPVASAPLAGQVSGPATAGSGSGAGWADTLGRRIDFYLEHFPEDPGPREIILPHNPMITRELAVAPGDILIGRPLGMSCGCPITHCGVVREVDHRTGVIVWCVTGPLDPRRHGFKDLGYYIAEAYEGIIVDSAVEVSIGARYFFQPRMCMLQWRHSGLVNFVNRIDDGLQVRLEGLWIG